MQVTATEFKLNLGDKERGNARLTNPNISSVDAISGIRAGKVPADLDRHAIREERQSKYAMDD